MCTLHFTDITSQDKSFYPPPPHPDIVNAFVVQIKRNKTDSRVSDTEQWRLQMSPECYVMSDTNHMNGMKSMASSETELTWNTKTLHYTEQYRDHLLQHK